MFGKVVSSGNPVAGGTFHRAQRSERQDTRSVSLDLKLLDLEATRPLTVNVNSCPPAGAPPSPQVFVGGFNAGIGMRACRRVRDGFVGVGGELSGQSV